MKKVLATIAFVFLMALPSSAFAYQVKTASIHNPSVSSFFGDPAHSGDYFSMGFQTVGAGTVGTVGVWMDKEGLPTGNLTASIYAKDGSGYPTGSVIATSDNIDATTLTNGVFSLQTFTFAAPPSLTASTDYTVVLHSSGTPDASKYFGLGGVDPGDYSGGLMAHSASANSGYVAFGTADVYMEINVTAAASFQLWPLSFF